MNRSPARHAPPRLLWDDEHDRRLLANVHPPDWRNPTPRSRYHLVAIGGGTAGLVTAAIGAALGARVALIERAFMGGDCLNVGCVPSKTLLAASRAGGVSAGSFARAMERVRRVRADVSEHDSAKRFQELGVDVFLGNAAFTSPETVSVEGVELRFRRAVIAAGTRPSAPPIPGLANVGFLTNENVFSLTSPPARLLVIGGGPIGCELAQAFARLGSRVTILEAGPRILPAEDPEAAAVVAAALTRDGVEIVLDASATGAARDASGRAILYRRGREELEARADEILVATGRLPNTDDLDLERAEVAYDAAVGITVDDHLRTTNRKVFAIGDIASRLRFTHVADAHARLVVRNALFMGRSKVSDLVVPWCTYTTPELAHVGPPAAELATRTEEIESITVPFDTVDRAKVEGETAGFLRVHHRKGSDRIVAATVVGAHAGEIIGQLTQAITAGIGLAKLATTILPYPTRAEAVRRAADQWGRRKLTPRVRAGFDAWFRLTR